MIMSNLPNFDHPESDPLMNAVLEALAEDEHEGIKLEPIPEDAAKEDAPDEDSLTNLNPFDELPLL